MTSHERKGSDILKLLKPRCFSTVKSNHVEADSWIKRMTKIKEIGNFSDEEMIFMVGDYLDGSIEQWYQIIGSEKTSWSDFVGAFRQLCVDETLSEKRKSEVKFMYSMFLSISRSSKTFDFEEFDKINNVFLNSLTIGTSDDE